MTKKTLPPIHPGEILREEFLLPMGVSQYRLAKEIGVSPRRINEIVHGKRAISADTALRLSRYFGMSERFWINLQGRYDIEVEKDLLADRLDREVRPLKGLLRRSGRAPVRVEEMNRIIRQRGAIRRPDERPFIPNAPFRGLSNFRARRHGKCEPLPRLDNPPRKT